MYSWLLCCIPSRSQSQCLIHTVGKIILFLIPTLSFILAFLFVIVLVNIPSLPTFLSLLSLLSILVTPSIFAALLTLSLDTYYILQTPSFHLLSFPTLTTSLFILYFQHDPSILLTFTPLYRYWNIIELHTFSLTHDNIFSHSFVSSVILVKCWYWSSTVISLLSILATPSIFAALTNTKLVRSKWSFHTLTLLQNRKKEHTFSLRVILVGNGVVHSVNCYVLSTDKRSSEEAEKEAPAAKKAKVQEKESTEAVEETAA